jgi:hypothetical protein
VEDSYDGSLYRILSEIEGLSDEAAQSLVGDKRRSPA